MASDQGADILDHLATANPVSLCVPMACEEDKQPTREGHYLGVAYNEQRGQRGGLGWKAPDVSFRPSKVPRRIFAWAAILPEVGCLVSGTKSEAGNTFTPEEEAVWRRIKAQTYKTTQASDNPLAACGPMACEENLLPTRVWHK
uniref:Uncharacterized protein n=1 Tax=Mesocestoides corti TaxID=53468 RepID=A0A5K3EHG6_MESCO